MRAARRIRRRWLPLRAGPGINLVYNKHYAIELPGALMDSQRALKVLSFLQEHRLLRPGQLHRARRISLARMQSVHSDAYLESLQAPGSLTPLLGWDISDDLQDRFLIAARAMVGGTIYAAQLALDVGGVVVNLGGGFHHAAADRGEGFCAFNDVAVAIRDLRRDGFGQRILVIDLDLHDGDGTRAVFAEDPSVHTFSLHNRHLEPRAALASTSVALGENVDDTAYQAALAGHLPPLLAGFKPGLVFYLAGTDPAADDKRGTWCITPQGMLARDQYVVDRVRQAAPGCPIIVLLAGGYGQNAWRYSARFVTWLLEAPDLVDTALTWSLPLDQGQRHLRKLGELDLIDGMKGDDWGLTEDDLYPLGRPRPTRFLGCYSRHGLDVLFERAGIYDKLRAKGYRNLRVEWNLDDPAGQTVRIVSAQDQPCVLSELRARPDVRTIPGMSLLAVEWLSLQDVKGDFTPARPRLPGQDYPGLGLLREFAVVLKTICECLGWDGIAFVPTHYSMAAQAQHLIRFLEPRAEGRFRALQAAVSGLTLIDAIKLVDGGRIVHGDTGKVFRWEPAQMILPVSRRLQGTFEDQQYQRDVQEALSCDVFVVRDSDTI
jgi:acetoin utilization deacetylase AcuC-like enzyme